MPNIVITGAGSGCGRGFVEAFSRNPSNTIFAIDRTFRFTSIFTAGLDEPRNQSIIVTYEEDLSSETDVASLSTWLSSFKVVFDIVIHCAGVRGLVPGVPISDQASIATADSINRMDASTMLYTFNANALASFLFLRAILRFCRRCNACGTPSRPPPSGRPQKEQGSEDAACPACLPMAVTKVLVLGSRRGSMMTASSALGGCYAYRASKAAQHAIVRSLVADAPDIIWLLCLPGRVHTALVPVREEGPLRSKNLWLT